MLIENMKSAQGNKVPNQFILTDRKGVQYFQSYESMIAVIKNDVITLDKTYWNYSVTTSKYRNIFTGLDTKQTKQGIKDGTIKLANLNK